MRAGQCRELRVAEVRRRVSLLGQEGDEPDSADSDRSLSTHQRTLTRSGRWDLRPGPNLSAELGVETIDLIESLTEFQEDYSRMYASPFDAHPSAEIHRLMAEALYGRAQLSWPELSASERSP